MASLLIQDSFTPYYAGKDGFSKAQKAQSLKAKPRIDSVAQHEQQRSPDAGLAKPVEPSTH